MLSLSESYSHLPIESHSNTTQSIHKETSNALKTLHTLKPQTPQSTENLNSTKSNTFNKSTNSPTKQQSSHLLTNTQTLSKLKKHNPSILNTIYKQIIKEENLSFVYNRETPDLKRQKDINEVHRGILIDWLINVHLYLQLTDETLFLTVKLIDIFLARVENFPKNNLQLLGVSALLISSKYLETFHSTIDSLSQLCDGAYSSKEIIQFETILLNELNYTIVQDNLVNFYDLLSMIFNFDLDDYYLGKFLLEITLLDISFYKYKKTLLVFSVVYLVMKMNLSKHPDYKKCFFYLKDTECNEREMKSLGKKILTLMDNVKGSSTFTSSYQKYLGRNKEKSKDGTMEDSVMEV